MYYLHVKVSLIRVLKRRLLFWSVSDTCYNVEQLSREFEKHVKTACQRGVSSEDLDLLMQCKLHMCVLVCIYFTTIKVSFQTDSS